MLKNVGQFADYLCSFRRRQKVPGGRGGRKLEWKKGKGEEENTKGKWEGVRKGRKEMG